MCVDNLFQITPRKPSFLNKCSRLGQVGESWEELHGAALQSWMGRGRGYSGPRVSQDGRSGLVSMRAAFPAVYFPRRALLSQQHWTMLSAGTVEEQFISLVTTLRPVHGGWSEGHLSFEAALSFWDST